MTSPEETIIAVVPAFNEETTIRRVLEGILPLVTKVIVIDDHSRDATASRALGAGAQVVRLEKNGGYDAALNRGFQEAASNGATIIVTFDADGEHDPKDLPRVVAPILWDEADISIGERPNVRHWGEQLFAFYTRLRFGINDPLCGMKAYRRSVYDQVGFFDSKCSIGTELTIRGIKKGFRLTSVPVMLHQRELGDRSRFYAANLSGNFRILRALFRVMGL